LSVVHKTRALGSLIYLTGVLLALQFDLGLVGVAASLLLAQALTTLFVAAKVPPHDRPGQVWSAGFHAQAVHRLLGLGALYFLTTFGWQLIVGTDTLVIASALGLVSVARYVPASRLVDIVFQALFVVLGTLQPLLAESAGKGAIGKAASLHLAAVRGCSVVAALFVPGVAFFGQFVLLAWVGEAGYSGYAVLFVLGLFAAARAISYASGAILAGLGQMGAMATVTLVEGVINLGLSLFLVRRLGVLGVALGSLLAHLAVSSWALPLAACRKTRTSLRDYLKALAYRPPFVAAAALMGGVLVRFLTGPPSAPLQWLRFAGAFLLISVASAWWIGLTGTERKLLAGHLNGRLRARSATP
jgi:O-antigen/teichoic acid export membrane protein